MSSLCRRPFLRRHNESHFAAEPPERAFLRRFRVSGFCLRSFARAKNGVNSERRSHKISVSEAKCNICRHKRAAALHLIRRLRRHLPLEGKAKSARRNRAARIANKHFLPRIQKLFPLCTTSLSLPPPVVPVPRGVSGGGAALSPGF